MQQSEIPAGVTLTWLHHPAVPTLSSPDQPKHGRGAEGGGPSIPSLDKYLISRPP